MDVTREHLEILQHTVGCDRYGRGEMYRNRYVTAPGAADDKLCRELVQAGLMAVGKVHPELAGNSTGEFYLVTEEGKSHIRTASPSPPVLTRGQQRYRQFLNADSGMSFIEWLKTGRYKEYGFWGGQNG